MYLLFEDLSLPWPHRLDLIYTGTTPEERWTARGEWDWIREEQEEGSPIHLVGLFADLPSLLLEAWWLERKHGLPAGMLKEHLLDGLAAKAADGRLEA